MACRLSSEICLEDNFQPSNSVNFCQAEGLGVESNQGRDNFRGKTILDWRLPSMEDDIGW